MKRIASVLGLSVVFLVSACGGKSNNKAPVTPQTTAATNLTLEQAGLDPAWMDRTVDPCQDFFAYACGGFVKSKTIPSDRATWGASEELIEKTQEYLRGVLEQAAKNEAKTPSAVALEKKIGDYYAACMDEDAIEKAGVAPVRPLLDEIAKVKDFKTLASAITKLHAATVFALFDTGSQQDFGDATRVICGLDQDGLGLPDRDYYVKDEPRLKEVRAFYTSHVERMFALGGMPAVEAKTAAADVMRIETKLAKQQQDKVTRRDPHAIYHRVDRDGLAKITKGFPWDEYWKGIGFPDTREISVNVEKYFTEVVALMRAEPAGAWRHYLTWQVLHSESPVLQKSFVNEAFALRQKLSGQGEIEPRWKRCVRSTDQALGELLAQSYVAEKFAGDSKAKAVELVDAIRGAMKADLETIDWMDDATRKAALAKLAKIDSLVGYPDRWRAYDFAVSRASYAENAIAADGFDFRRRMSKVGKPVDRRDWLMTPPTVNAYYEPTLNQIALPAGQLQPPFFSRAFYPPVNLGNEGANTVGHELTHAFDDEGSQFDGDGNLRDWWTKATKAKFEVATQCVRDQYSQFDAVPGTKLNGALTSGENIADIGGMKLGVLALEAWKKAHPEPRVHVDGTSDEQVLFLGYAQGWCSKERPEYLETMARTNPHSPPRWRVNGPMANVPAFATAFQCKAGTPMNPGKTCAVW